VSLAIEWGPHKITVNAYCPGTFPFCSRDVCSNNEPNAGAIETSMRSSSSTMQTWTYNQISAVASIGEAVNTVEEFYKQVSPLINSSYHTFIH